MQVVVSLLASMLSSLLASMWLPHPVAMSPLLGVASPLPAMAFLLVAAAGSPWVVTLSVVVVALSTAAVPLSAVVSLVSPSPVVAPLLASMSLPLWAVTLPPLVVSSLLAVARVPS